MGIAKTGNVSLTALRQDLDMSAAGSMYERAILNKDGQRSSGNVTLSAYRGNIVGGQLSFHPSAAINATPSDRQYGYKGWFSSPGGTPIISGNTIRTYNTMPGSGGSPNGNSCEYRVSGMVSEDGTYRFTGNLSFTRSLNYMLQTWQVRVIVSSSGYLNGPSQIAPIAQSGLTPGNFSLNYTCSLTTAKPYLTLIVTTSSGVGGNPAEGSFESIWTNLKLVKT